MNKVKIQSIFCFCISCLLLCSCDNGKRIDIEVSDINQVFNASMFKGVAADIEFDKLCDILGEPNEYLDKESGEDKEHSPIYYFPDGKIICHWGGARSEKIGCIDYIPYENKPMYIQDILNVPISSYGITEKTKNVRIYEGDTLYFLIILENYRVKEIEYWLVEKKFLNVAW